MKIYFTAAIVYKDKLGENYEKIVEILEKNGHQVFSEHILKTEIPEILSLTDTDRIRFYRKFLKRISSCNLFVAEASFPSTLHIGHEISIALEKGKPVIALYLEGKMPFFLEGIKSEKLFLTEYTRSDLEKTLLHTLEVAKEQMDTRFTLLLPPEIVNFLDEISRERKTPKSVFIRNLIKREMEKKK